MRALPAIIAFALSAFVSIASLRWPPERLWDFASFIAAGRALESGLNPYVIHPDIVAGMGTWVGPNSPNLNAPASLPFLHCLAWIEPTTGFTAFVVASLITYALVVGVLLRAYRQHATPIRLAWAFSLAGLWHGLMLGQIYVLLLAIIAVAWFLLERQRFVLAGLVIGILVAIKPPFLLWPFLLFVAGHRRASLSAAMTLIPLCLLPVILYGPSVYGQWVAASSAYPHLALPVNTSLMGAAARLGLSEFGAVAAFGLGIGVTIWTWRQRLIPITASSVALTAIILVAPLGWLGNTVWLLPVLLSRRWALLFWIAAILLLMPSNIISSAASISPVSSASLGSLYTVALLIALWAQLRATRECSYVRPQPIATGISNPRRCRPAQPEADLGHCESKRLRSD